MRYCIYESRRSNAECVVAGQCPACLAYQSGVFAPHFKLPTIINRNYLLDGHISQDTGAWMLWFVDGVIVV